MDNFCKTYRLGMTATGSGKLCDVFVKVKYLNGNLSLTGVEGPKPSGNAVGGYGQLDRPVMQKYAPGWSHEKVDRLFEIWKRWHLNDMRPGCEHQRDWDTEEKIQVTTYKRSTQYQLMASAANDGRLTGKEYAAYRKVVGLVQPVLDSQYKRADHPYDEREVQALLDQGWIMVDKVEEKATGWVYPNQHPKGLLTKPCAECGYKYGSAWLREEVPDEVLQELIDFPDTDKQPAWI